MSGVGGFPQSEKSLAMQATMIDRHRGLDDHFICKDLRSN